MNQPNEMKALTRKLDELQNQFKVGEKIIPSIQKLIDFMNEIVPLLNNINSSIEETTSKIPKVSDHISDVTSATEIATTEILDKVDEISNEVSLAEETYIHFTEKYLRMQTLIVQLKEIVSENPEAAEIIEEIIKLNGLSKNNINIKGSIEKVKQYLQEITITLQVQDITAQQLSSINHLILSVQKKLSSLIFEISGEGMKVSKKANNVVVPSTDHFDPNASFNRDGHAQEMANELVDKKASQDEIDLLFGSNGN